MTDEVDRPRGVIVYPIEHEHPAFHDGMDYGLLVASDSIVYVVCSEGVGWPLRSFIEKYTDTLLPDDLFASVQGSKPVDLADFVRSFGARLESNFSLWYAKGIKAS